MSEQAKQIQENQRQLAWVKVILDQLHTGLPQKTFGGALQLVHQSMSDSIIHEAKEGLPSAAYVRGRGTASMNQLMAEASGTAFLTQPIPEAEEVAFTV